MQYMNGKPCLCLLQEWLVNNRNPGVSYMYIVNFYIYMYMYARLLKNNNMQSMQGIKK